MRFQQFGRTLLLTALVLGLNVLGMLAITHARHPNHARANVAHGHGSSLRRATRDQAGADDDGEVPDVAGDVHVAKTHQRWPLSHIGALRAELIRLFSPEFISAPLAAVPSVARSSAPRAPGISRGPPTA